jgi:hypothetical protein
MAIVNIYLDLDLKYINLINDILKTLVILIMFQLLISTSLNSKNIINSALSGKILNDDFMLLVIYILIGISSYYLIFDKLFYIS